MTLWVFILSWNVSGDLIGATYQTLISNSIPSCHKIFMVLNILTSEKDPQMTFVSTDYLCFARLSWEGLSNYYFWDFWGFSRPNPQFPAVSLFQRMKTTVISDVIKVGINFSHWKLRLRWHCTVKILHRHHSGQGLLFTHKKGVIGAMSVTARGSQVENHHTNWPNLYYL